MLGLLFVNLDFLWGSRTSESTLCVRFKRARGRGCAEISVSPLDWAALGLDSGGLPNGPWQDLASLLSNLADWLSTATTIPRAHPPVSPFLHNRVTFPTLADNPAVYW